MNLNGTWTWTESHACNLDLREVRESRCEGKNGNVPTSKFKCLVDKSNVISNSNIMIKKNEGRLQDPWDGFCNTWQNYQIPTECITAHTENGKTRINEVARLHGFPASPLVVQYYTLRKAGS